MTTWFIEEFLLACGAKECKEKLVLRFIKGVPKDKRGALFAYQDPQTLITMFDLVVFRGWLRVAKAMWARRALWLDQIAPTERTVYLAVKSRSDEMLKFVLSLDFFEVSSEALLRAISHENTLAVSLLLKAGAPANVIVRSTYPLCRAVIKGNELIVMYLLAYDAHVVDYSFTSTLRLAIAEEKYTIFKLLFAFGVTFKNEREAFTFVSFSEHAKMKQLCFDVGLICSARRVDFCAIQGPSLFKVCQTQHRFCKIRKRVRQLRHSESS